MEFEHHDHIREDMTDFWKGHSEEATLTEMMLDFEADELSPKEIKEVLALLPDVKGKRVLELGAGIGRYTGEIAKHAKSVVAVDFMEKFIKKNEELNSHLGNIEFVQADVTTLKLLNNSFDVVFSNWLFMYLDDDESFVLMQNIMNWLTPNGHFFLRESCYHSCGMARNNRNQLCWLVQKTESAHNVPKGYHNLQEFLDEQLYSRNNILKYEKVYGKSYTSPGGEESTKKFVQMLDLKPDQNVLDVGCGIGGGVFYMAQNFDVQILGIDLSQNVIEIARKKATDLKNSKIDFEITDVTEREYAEGKYDAIYTRDTLLHIDDKNQLLKKFYNWLSPGGKVVITDYCCTNGKWSEDLTKYVAKKEYHLLSIQQYRKALEDAGFVNIKTEDQTHTFMDILQKELTHTAATKHKFINEFSEEEYNDIVQGWKNKIERCKAGQQTWGLFYAEKRK